METMSQNPEQFYKPQNKAGLDDKPHLKLNLNLGQVDDKFNSMLSSPDLKKVAIDTPELDRMVANSSLVFSSSGYTPLLGPTYRDDGISVQGPSVSQIAPDDSQDDNVTRSFIQALREIHEQNDFKSETFNIPATNSEANPIVPTFSESIQPGQQICSSQSWGTFPTTVSSYGYNPPPPNYISTQPTYMPPEQIPAYQEQKPAVHPSTDNYLPDLGHIDKLNLTTAEKLQIYSQIPIHEVTDPQLQEQLKAERKKMRNRIAASKCRKRKLQKEAELEDKVKILKKKNTDLSSQLLGLRDEVKELKVKIMTHVNAGCNIKQYGGASNDMHYPSSILHHSVSSSSTVMSSVAHPLTTQSLTTTAGGTRVSGLHQGMNMA